MACRLSTAPTWPSIPCPAGPAVLRHSAAQRWWGALAVAVQRAMCSAVLGVWAMLSLPGAAAGCQAESHETFEQGRLCWRVSVAIELAQTSAFAGKCACSTRRNNSGRCGSAGAASAEMASQSALGEMGGKTRGAGAVPPATSRRTSDHPARRRRLLGRRMEQRDVQPGTNSMLHAQRGNLRQPLRGCIGRRATQRRRSLKGRRRAHRSHVRQRGTSGASWSQCGCARAAPDARAQRRCLTCLASLAVSICIRRNFKVS